MIGLNERMVKKARVVNHFAFETWDQTNVKGNEKTDPEYCQHFLTEAVILFIYVCVCVFVCVLLSKYWLQYLLELLLFRPVGRYIGYWIRLQYNDGAHRYLKAVIYLQKSQLKDQVKKYRALWMMKQLDHTHKHTRNKGSYDCVVCDTLFWIIVIIKNRHAHSFKSHNLIDCLLC